MEIKESMSVTEGTEEVCKFIPDCTEEERAAILNILEAVNQAGFDDGYSGRD